MDDLIVIIAIVPTACGIETLMQRVLKLFVLLIAIVPTACGIETAHRRKLLRMELRIAIVPTACGIETIRLDSSNETFFYCNSTYRLRY